MSLPISVNENGMRRVHHFTRNIASRIEAEAERTDNPAAVAQAVGEQLPRQVPAAFPDTEAKSVSLECKRSLAPRFRGRGGGLASCIPARMTEFEESSGTRARTHMQISM